MALALPAYSPSDWDDDDDLYAPVAKRPRYDDSSLPPSTPPPIASTSEATSATAGLSTRSNSSATVRGQSPDGDETRSTSRTVDQDSERGSDDGMDVEDGQLPPLPELVQDEVQAGDFGDTAQSGIIEQVDLYQFMCHTYITIKFGPQMNFLVGHNGSGKSAVLTGITMALGGNAKATNRATNGAGLVKEGAASAKCRVRLSNRGSDPYRQDLFGASITVERTLRSNGGSSYKLMNHRGEVVETSKVVLDSIRTFLSHRLESAGFFRTARSDQFAPPILPPWLTVDHFEIQIDNPITVLTQDQSRAFIASTTGKDKYKAFLRGTMLSQLRDEYTEMGRHIESIQVAIEKKNELMPELQLVLRRAMERAEAGRAAEEQVDRLKELENRRAWCDVEWVEAEIKKGRTAIRKAEEKLVVLRHHLAVATAKRDAAMTDLADLEEAQAETQLQKDEQTPKLEEVQQGISAARAKTLAFKVSSSGRSHVPCSVVCVLIDRHLGRIQNEERQMAATIDLLKQGIEAFKAQLVVEHDRLARDIEAEERPIHDRIAKNEDEIRRHEQIVLEADQERLELEGRSTLLQKLEAAAPLISRYQKEAADLHKRIQNVEASRTNSMLAYGPKMPTVLRDVDATRWTKKPLGPVGRYIEVRDQQWSNVIESLCGRILNAFVVSNEQDRIKLSALLHRHGVGSIHSIIKLRYDDTFDCSSGEPDSDLLTVLRAIKISDRLVEQAFINGTGCEDAVLVQRRSEGDQLFDAGRRNIRVVYSRDWFIVRRSRDNKAASIVMAAWRGQRRLSPDIAGQIAMLTNQLDSVNIHLSNISRDKQEADDELASIHRRGKAADLRRQESKRSLTQLRRQVENDRHQLLEKAPSDISAIEDLRDESQAELDSTLAQYEEALRRHNAETGTSDLASFVRKKEEINLAIKEADDLLSRLMKKINTAVAERSEAEKVIAKHQKKLDEVQAEVEMMREQVDEMQEHASTICERPPRFPRPRTAEQLDHDIKTLKAAIRARERDLGATLDELNEEVGRRNQVVQRAKSILSSLENFVELLETARRVRMEKWEGWLTSLPTSLELHFLNYLATRSFTGRLKFNHKDEELNLHIMTKEEGAKNHGKHHSRWKDVKSLSGGEKSFATICLLLAMWKVAACHIRCLDEFDVFMDAVNRRVAMKMMVDTAKNVKRAQFILITPQNVSNSTYGAEVKIIMLGDPARTSGQLAARPG
ncbi:BZ3500_MvSof-1268-A1-R1_Chr7-1g09293 [Microbotryum saponariae]|uniref:BZ3500_MvSof-1268-A1-R1_Chr7-1g09293 protein n=1 Tax=Microbotryum saponariae TaxID=289078 RepID=A0A2X0L8R2_9BASI|nr:BZ3501_MvSof-1269-A2-R1_Chr7-1g08998 [Microbotryum saponariae]SDA03174.1 BZ3500_MvSof-1268-A1-R1_Chr7-1g09293 [Microbotryum saponariae]